MKSARSVTKVHSSVNDSIDVAESLLDTGSGRLAAPLDKDVKRNGTSDHSEVTSPNKDSEQRMHTGSPIRLLQDYASDETSDNEDEKGYIKDANNFLQSLQALVLLFRIPIKIERVISRLKLDVELLLVVKWTLGCSPNHHRIIRKYHCV